MVDHERILAKLDDLDGYIRELRAVAPQDFAAYRKTEKKRACERLLQIAVECVIDICNLFVTGLRLGLPAEENDLFEKLADAGVISPHMGITLMEMKGFCHPDRARHILLEATTVTGLSGGTSAHLP